LPKDAIKNKKQDGQPGKLDSELQLFIRKKLTRLLSLSL
jgi:hypothetical protein